jgi:DNA polymerase-3 subunit delta'
LFVDAPSRSLEIGPNHPVARRVASGGHADLLVVERGVNPDTGKPRTEIVVEDIRAIGDFMHLTPIEGGWRVVIVDGAEDMNTNAQNALLKVLEEPAERAVLLLVSHAPGRLLATVRSRCRQVLLPTLPSDQVETLLARFAPDLPAADRGALAQLAEGSIGRALQLVELDGLGLYRQILALASAPTGEALHGLAERVGGFGATPGELRCLAELAQRLVRSATRAASGTPPPLALAGEEGRVIDRLATRGVTYWLGAWDRIRRLDAAGDGLNLDRKQIALALLAAVAPHAVTPA